MDCSDARIAISARLDGEASDLDSERLDAHLASCANCRSYTADLQAAHRRLRLNAAEPVPDLTRQIFAAINAETQDVHDARVGGLRAGLAAVAMIQILIALPALLLGEDAGLPAHTARHLGSFAVALGIGFLVAAWRPERVGGLLPLTAALVACLLLTSGLDVAASRADALSELGGHATELVGLGLLALLARETGSATFRWERRAPSGPSGGAAHS